MLHALKHHWPDYLLEAFGLLIFMLGAGALGTLFQYPNSPVAQAIPSDLLKRTGLGLCMGLIIFAIVATIGKRTGAHINPAVTWAFYRHGKIGAWDAFFYTVVQFAAAIVAPVMLLATIGTPFRHPKVDYAVSHPGPQGVAIAFAAEFVISYILMFAMVVVLGSKKLEKLAPMITGALIALYIALESPLSGMSLNPARSFGSALTASQFDHLWIYFTAPVLAMLLAVETYSATNGHRCQSADFRHGPSYPVEKESPHG